MNGIAVYRHKANMTQQDLADATGMKRLAIARYEVGSRRPSIDKLEVIANVLHCTVDDLIHPKINSNTSGR